MLKNGDTVKVIGNTTGHPIPIGMPVVVINITDDEYKVWDGVRFHWIDEIDIEDKFKDDRKK
jgi:hypothetical protein